jgi:hypothetical protein
MENGERGTSFGGYDGYARLEFPEQMFPRGIAFKILEGYPRMASVDEYLQYAKQCVALAAKSSNAADRARLLQMAQAWRDLSEKRDNAPKKDPAG